MKAWRDIEKRYKIIFYLAIIVIYFFFLEFFYDLGSRTLSSSGPGTLRSLGIGHYLWSYTIFYSWFLIAVLGYFSRNRFDGMMIGLTIWTPWLIRALAHPEYSGEFLGMVLYLGLIFSALGAAVGMFFGFIGSKRRKYTLEGG